MKKAFLLIIALLCFYGAASAQNAKGFAGFRAGGTASIITGDRYPFPTPRFGLGGGIFVIKEFKKSRVMGYRMDIDFLQMGTRYTTNIVRPYSLETLYAQFSPQLIFNLVPGPKAIDGKLYFNIGPSLNILLLAQEKELRTALDLTSKYRSLNYGINGGFTYMGRMNKDIWLTADVRGIYLLNNIKRYPDDMQKSISIYASVGFAYVFKFKQFAY
ncbi:MAG: hypothetical protein EAZ57_05970 [Cytophagales bacterium]|nr:MAG: hypothetical protein EAZ67_08160 [Cytophagales bacterium]TAF60731.1 MAG: hypothetical protein EAZ57_05970 [Cytophagales bacterium]